MRLKKGIGLGCGTLRVEKIHAATLSGKSIHTKPTLNWIIVITKI